VVKDDKDLDVEFKAVMRQLVTFMMEDPRSISHGIDTLFAAKAMERIGDHAKNVAQHTVFLVRGRDVRHFDASEIMKEVGYTDES
jgi:phosphate transport system protein